jgi:TonB family protein
VQLPNVNMSQYGDPLGKLGPPSNGPGSGGGIGSGKGGGVGSGTGGGVGPGEGGGIGGGPFRVGGGVTAPSVLHKVEPEYSEEARKAKYQGTVLLYIEVDPSGRATNIKVQRSLGLGLDEKAIEAVKQWKFKPGYKDGKPVTVAATIEVNFRLL